MAGTSQVNVKIIGIENLRAKLTPAIAGRPVRRFMERGTRLVFNTAVRDVPVFQGRLKGAHAIEIDPATLPQYGKIGVKVDDYASDVHFGTPPHYVPPSELDPWAAFKKIKGGGEAASDWIAARGTAANQWLYNALASNEAGIKALVPVLAADIEQAYSNG